MKFSDLSLIPPIQQAVAEAGYTVPSPIQEKAIPPALSGKDLLACAQTGTGKTAAFALPILQLLTSRNPGPGKPIRSLILTPTRELALQIYENLLAYGKHLPLKSAVIFGGVGQNPQVAALKKGVDILVATPGRLNDLIGQGFIKLDRVEIFVLDEADRMLDMGFVHDVKKVLALLPAKKQSLLFSATMPNEIVSIANQLLHTPAKVFVTPVSSTVDKIDQSVYKVDKTNKRHLLAHCIKEFNIDRVLVFSRTKHGADRIVRELTRAGVKAMAIHGNKGQSARQQALAKFKNGEITALVATDIAARGLDIDDLSYVINYDLPNLPETYVHRIGRTGRAGKTGTAISFCSVDELEYLDDIQKLTGQKLVEATGHPWPLEVLDTLQDRKNKQGDSKVQNNNSNNHQNPGNPNAPAKENRQNNNYKNKQNKAKAPHSQVAAADSKPGNANPKQNRSNNAPSGKGGKPYNKGGKNQNGQPRGKNQGGRPSGFDPYENLTGSKAIITKRPVWSTGDSSPEPPAVSAPSSPQQNRNKNANPKNRPAPGKPGAPAPAPSKKPEPAPAEKKIPEIPKDEKGIYNFSESELSEDQALKVISRKKTETKYASFEDFLKDH